MAAIEHIARETILGLIEQVMELTHPRNDNNPAPWSEVENKAYEIIRISQTVQDGILRRGVQTPLFEED